MFHYPLDCEGGTDARRIKSQRLLVFKLKVQLWQMLRPPRCLHSSAIGLALSLPGPPCDENCKGGVRWLWLEVAEESKSET